MKLRQAVAALSVSAMAVIGLQTTAGADGAGFTVSTTTVVAGGSVTVTLTEACVTEEGAPDYGNVNLYNETTGTVVSVRDIKFDEFINGATATFTLATPGEYSLQRFCDDCGYMGRIDLTATAPVTTTTAPTTTAAPTTTVAGATTVAPSTTVAPVKVEKAVEVKPAPAKGATPIKSRTVSYTG